VKVGCPFYGFHWPDKTSDLFQVESNECGLDVQCHGPCQMEESGRTVSFDYCEVPLHWKPLLESFSNEILFHIRDAPKPVSLAAWRRQTVPLRKSAS
jgi:hypothetical protein